MPEFRDHFSSRTASYAKFRPTYPRAIFEYLASLSPSRQLAWDCGCGNGQATVDLAAFFDRVVGTDASASQIAAARAHPKVEYRIAPAEQSGLEASSVDLIIVAQALHWFNVETFYPEARRVLRSRGILGVWSYAMSRVEGVGVNAIAQDFYANVIGPHWPPERKIVEDGYATLTFPQPEISAPEFQMRTRWTLDQLLGYFSSWSGTKNYVQARGEDPIPLLRERLETVWGGPDRRRIVEWPLVVRVWRQP